MPVEGVTVSLHTVVELVVELSHVITKDVLNDRLDPGIGSNFIKPSGTDRWPEPYGRPTKSAIVYLLQSFSRPVWLSTQASQVLESKQPQPVHLGLAEYLWDVGHTVALILVLYNLKVDRGVDHCGVYGGRSVQAHCAASSAPLLTTSCVFCALLCTWAMRSEGPSSRASALPPVLPASSAIASW